MYYQIINYALVNYNANDLELDTNYRNELQKMMVFVR